MTFEHIDVSLEICEVCLGYSSAAESLFCFFIWTKPHLWHAKFIKSFNYTV